MAIARLYFSFVLSVAVVSCLEIETFEDITTSVCSNDAECKDTTNGDDYVNNTTKEVSTTTAESVNSVTESTSDPTNVSKKDNSNATSPQQIQTTSVPSTTVIPVLETILPEIGKRNPSLHKTQREICECDLTVSSCDINCCCDDDCKESQITVFSHCKDYQPKVYDSRYCYTSDFIEYNNSELILERLTSNLFCIVYDNLPPAYSTSYTMEIPNRKKFNEVISGLDRSKFTWQWETIETPPQFNTTYSYRDGNTLWKLEGNSVKPIEILQTGFTGLCAFKKTLQYLRDWSGSCMQNNLSNTNSYLFPTAFNDFTIIRSPLLFNQTYLMSDNQTCPRNICLTLENYYCSESSDTCNNTKEISGSCADGICTDIIKSVRYVITHNGTIGIINVKVYFGVGDVTDKFYQHFEVTYRWLDVDPSKIFRLSGNPGYVIGKPIVIGSLVTNETNGIVFKHIEVNRKNCFATLPIRRKDGECHELKRYTIGFGENVKSKCSVILRTNNFTVNSCAELQNKTLETLLQQTLNNVTEIGQYKIYVSKEGRININSTYGWVPIFLDRNPRNVLTGHVIKDQIRCSGLVTSIRIDIIHSVFPESQITENHKVLGASITFSEAVDVLWPKCVGTNCTDTLKVDVISYVAFHDVSRPSKYYFVGGPNLDISLPYDFFYPFLSDSTASSKPSSFILGYVIAKAIFQCISL